MAETTVGRENNAIKQIIADFRNGVTTAEECFCMVLSLEGYESTRFCFPSLIDCLKLAHSAKHTKLFNIYNTYFSQCPTNEFTDPIECSVENGLLTSDFGYELDIEAALACSLSDSLHVGSGVQQSFASLFNKPGKPDASVKCKQKQGPVCSNVPSENIPHTSHQTSGSVTNIPGLALSDENLTKAKRRKKGKKNNKDGFGIPNSLSNKPVVYWIRKDLRIYDNPALNAAVELNAPVIIVFLWSEKEEDPYNDIAAGGATKLWLHYALKELNTRLIEKYGNGIIFRKTSDSKTEMKRIFAETGATNLVMNTVYEPFLKARDDKICNNLEMKGVTCKRFPSYLLYEPSSVCTDSIGMRGVGSVGHFMECCRRSSTEPIGHLLEPPGSVPRPNNIIASVQLDELELARMPRRKDGSVVWYLIICQLPVVSSADNFCKQFGPRSGSTLCGA